jgi:hypothetical protein
MVASGFVAFLVYTTQDHSCGERQQEQNRLRWKLEEQHHRDKINRLADIETQYSKRILDATTRAETLEGEVRMLNERVERLRNWERELEEEKLRISKMRLYWDDLLADEQCSGHERVHYRAYLRNVQPEVVDPVTACQETSITINGVLYDRPDWCEPVVSNSQPTKQLLLKITPQGGVHVYGHWTVSGEPKCASYWTHFNDKVRTSLDYTKVSLFTIYPTGVSCPWISPEGKHIFVRC